MRLGFDARGPTAQRRVVRTGVEYYAVNLLRYIAEQHRCITVIQQRGSKPLVSGDGIEIAYSRFANSSVWWGSFGLAMAARQAAIQALIIPEQYMPFIKPCPSLVVAHDTNFLRYPESYSRTLRLKLHLGTKSIAARADHIIAMSEDTKKCLDRYYGIAPHRVTVAYPGCDHSLFKPRQRAESEEILEALRIPERYLLYLGSVLPHKNIPLIVRALPHLPPSLHLVIAGRDTGHGADIRNVARTSNVIDRVHFIGYVDDAVKANLLSQATAFVFPSFHEGFGAPIVEAMSSGAPVVTSTRCALPEVLGDGGLAVDPLDVSAFVAAVRDVTDSKNRPHYAAAALSRARSFSWNKAADIVLAAALSIGRD